MNNPFFIGLGIGIAVALLVQISHMCKEVVLRKKIKQLDKEIGEQVRRFADCGSQNTKRMQDLEQRIRDLENQIRNQVVTIQMLKQQPSSRELRELRMNDVICQQMVMKAPGFAQAWTDCAMEIQTQEKLEEDGKIVFLRPLKGICNLLLHRGKMHSLSTPPPIVQPQPEDEKVCVQDRE